MKKLIVLFIAFFTLCHANAAEWNNAQWIWQQADGSSNTWMSFRKTVSISEIPDVVEAYVSVDSKYWLWINGEMVIFEGGFSRGPSQAGTWNRDAEIMPTNSWFETIDIKPYLKEGENTIAILAWYWGRMTNKGTHVDSGKGGLLFSTKIGSQTVVSDSTWKAIQHPGYDNTIEPASSRLVQYSVKFDAQKGMDDWSDNAWYTSTFDDTQWTTAVEKGASGAAPWYDLIETYVPRLINHGLVDYENNSSLNLPFVSTGKTYECVLPINKQITPYLEVEAEAGKTITITTDNRLNKITGTYITKAGVQSFESFSWMNGHKVKYTIPAGVTVKALKYRWMSVGEMSGSYEVSDPFYQRLWEMGNNTLFVCARDNFMDCPDRERALWIGDVADQTGYLFYCMDEAGHKLLKKAILQTCYFSENKVLGALGPARVRELVGQSLQFISQVVWPYYWNTGDIETLEIAYPYVYNYLALFPMQANGLPEYRKGKSPDAWDWVDWGVDNTIDKAPIQPAYYYEALVKAKEMAEVLGKTDHLNFYSSRISSIEANYDKVYWKNGFYSSNASKFKDDRANALAITSGLAKPENYAAIVDNVLVPNKYSSPHFEWVVEEAMFIAGKYTESLARMKEQYQSQVNSGLSTLYEMFPKGGSYNHAWNGSNTVLSKYVAGIKPLGVAWSSFEVSPVLVHLTSLKTKVPTVKGDILVEATRSASEFTLDLESPEGTNAIVGIHKDGATILEVKAGGQTIWKDGAFVSGVSGITFESESADFLKFKVESGIWNIQAEMYKDYPPTVSFTSPAANTALKKGYSDLEVSINASDDNGIAKVELFVDGQSIGSKITSPYSWTSSNTAALKVLSVGRHVLKAVATDTNGGVTETSMDISVVDVSGSFTSKLVFYYPLEEDGSDQSGNANHASMGSAVTYAPGKYGNAASFSYTEGSYFTSADSVFEYSNPATAYTIAFWLKVSDYSQRGDILQPSNGRTLLYSNGDLNFRCSHQKKTITFSVDESEKNDWLHVAILLDQRDGQRKHQVLINGEPRGGIAEGYDFDTGKPQSIGKLIFGSFSENTLLRNFTGMLDEVCMFNDILTEAEIKFIMNADNIKEYLSIPSSIQNVSASNKLHLFPNPTKDNIYFGGVKVHQAKVYTLSGQLTKVYEVRNNQVDVSQLSDGIYLMQIVGVDGQYYQYKIVIE